MNRKILAFDVSTKATGAVIYDEATKTHIHELFEASQSDITKRIKTIAVNIFEWIKDKNFDMVLITKASAVSMNPQILQLEGILLGIAIKYDIPFDYYPDVSWYSLIGSPKDERPTKKKNSVQAYLDFHNLKVIDKNIKWSRNKLEKISVKVEWVVGEKWIPFMSDETLEVKYKKEHWISDDICDAWNAARLFEAREKREPIKFEKSERQTKINKLSSEIKSLGNKIKLRKEAIKNNLSEAKLKQEAYNLSGYKRDLNAYNTRIERDVTYGHELQQLEFSKELRIKERQELRDEKNNL